ncbi:MAG TPA: 1-deoxy-D-xylulose-5-phosphate reductoisomerase [Ktedonobacteraceae bacterium]|nr:1-deoxy-D-xylulose-5-phosphate reductoisomerase [Ktedonobacteraceae bacterium]
MRLLFRLKNKVGEDIRPWINMNTSFPKKIALLGSTGSIGRQTLDVVRAFPEHFQVVALAAHSNLELLVQQAQEFKPVVVACYTDTPEMQAAAKNRLPGAIFGPDGLMAAATCAEADMLVAATSGLMGMEPTLAAIRAGKTIAIANKETLVMAGHLVMEAARREGVEIYPIDSEHCAIWQCLRGEEMPDVRRLLLTASGGPFRTSSLEEIRMVSVEQALKHPTWKMGQKITIDSATLMNKGLEVLEARWLFDIPYERIEVVVHPESIIHSMVEFVDGSLKLQASLPSMHLPILYAMSYPQRLNTAETGLIRELNWADVARLTFEDLDIERFPCFRLALEAGKRGATYPSVLVGADEEAVALFLSGKIGLLDIAALIESVLSKHQPIEHPDVPSILEACAWARRMTKELASSVNNSSF